MIVGILRRKNDDDPNVNDESSKTEVTMMNNDYKMN